ncbi:fatty acid--CoA ligase FadD11 [Nocardia asteroides]|uniref:fatty acid--CoA ligase FadD11 n=1 Tax=Nocardia asteroides TaxID=1824 RepID=UPI0033D4A680
MITSNRATTMCAAFQRTAAIAPDAVALREPGDTQTLTWREYDEQVRAVAGGLAGLGIGRGDTIALMMGNRVEFFPLEVGAQHVGATSFSVYNTMSAEQMGHIFANAGNRMVICEAQYVERIRACGADVEFIICIDGNPEGTLAVEQLIAATRPDFDFDATWQAVQPEDVLTLIYTSGTTGNPKGVEMTHAALLFETYSVAAVLGVEFGDRITSFLPTAHIADRLGSLYFQEVFGVQVTAVVDAHTIAAALPDVRPTIWGAVPRVWEKLKAAIELTVANEPDPAARKALQWGLEVAARKADALLAGLPVPEDVEAIWRHANQTVLSGLRQRLGLCDLRWAMSGAAPVAPATLAFFAGLGVPIAEIWGMSELSCICTVSSPEQSRLGSVGKLLPGMESAIAEDGELLIRGPLVMKGYRNQPDKTDEAIDAEGWLHTGDIATQDDDGYFYIVDRKKELIINSAGKNISPAHIENTVKAASPLIGSLVALGDNRSYITALVALDAEMAPAYAARHDIAGTTAADLASEEQIVAQIRTAVALGNARVSRVEQIKRFLILPVFWEPGGDELTLTMKLRRQSISKKYAAELDALYAPAPGANVLEPAEILSETSQAGPREVR